MVTTTWQQDAGMGSEIEVSDASSFADAAAASAAAAAESAALAAISEDSALVAAEEAKALSITSFDTVADLLADTTTIDDYRARYGATGVVYAVVKSGGYRYSLDLAQSGSGDLTTSGGVEFNLASPLSGVHIRALGAMCDGVTDDSAEVIAAINLASSVGSAAGSVVDVIHEHGICMIDGGLGDSYDPAIPLKNYTRLCGHGTFKAIDGSYSAGNPALLGNDQGGSGTTEIHVEGITIDANASNNVETSGGAISLLFGRPVGPSGGAGAVGVDSGSIKNVKAIDTSFIAFQVKNGSGSENPIAVTGCTNNGGHYGFQGSLSKVQLFGFSSYDTQNNGIDIYGNIGELWTVTSKSGSWVVGDTVTDSGTGNGARLLRDNGDGTINVDFNSGIGQSAFTPTGTLSSASGGSGVYASKSLTNSEGEFMLSDCYVEGSLTNFFFETVSNVVATGLKGKGATGNGIILNRINSNVKNNRISGVIEGASSAGVFFSGEVNNNTVSASIVDCTTGIRHNGGSFNRSVDCSIVNCSVPVLAEGTGSKNSFTGGIVDGATTAFTIGASQANFRINHPEFVGVTTRVSDSSGSAVLRLPEEGTFVDISGASSSIGVNLQSGTVFGTKTDTLSTNTTIGAPSPSGGFTAGQEITFLFKQDGTGGRTVAWNGAYKVKTAVASGANKRSSYTFTWTGVFWECTSELIDY